jgi:hypothetical protein
MGGNSVNFNQDKFNLLSRIFAILSSAISMIYDTSIILYNWNIFIIY